MPCMSSLCARSCPSSGGKEHTDIFFGPSVPHTRGSTSLTLAASRGATPCVASPHLARSVLGGPLNPGFPGRDHDAFRTEALCDSLRAFRPALGEVVNPRDDSEVLEPGLPNRPQIVGLDRGPPDAIGPQLRIETAHGPDVLLDHDVRELESTSGAQDAEDLAEGGLFVRDEVEHTVACHDVHAGVRKGNFGRVPFHDRYVG